MAEYEVIVYERVRKYYVVQAESESEALHSWNDDNLVDTKVMDTQPICATEVEARS